MEVAKRPNVFYSDIFLKLLFWGLSLWHYPDQFNLSTEPVKTNWQANVTLIYSLLVIYLRQWKENISVTAEVS